MIAIMPKGPELGYQLINYQWTLTNAVRQVDILIEYRFPDTYVLAEAVVGGTPPELQLEGLHVTRSATSRAARSAFSLKGKSTIHFVFLVASIAIPVFILTVLVVCLRSAIPRKEKLLWLVYIVLGFGKISLNWNTGDIIVTELAVQLLGASAFVDAPTGAWILSVSLPAGALTFLVRRRALRGNRGTPQSGVTASGV